VDIPQQGVEQQSESIGSIGLCKNRTSFSTIFSTIFDLKNESQIRPELGDSQAGDKVLTKKNRGVAVWICPFLLVSTQLVSKLVSIERCAKQNCAPYYAAKTGFLVRSEMVRSEVRSESMKMDRGG